MNLKDIVNPAIELNEKDWKILQSLYIERSFKKGEYLVSRGNVENYINLVIEGSCRVFIIKNGIEYNWALAFENDWISSFESFSNNMPSDEYIKAMTDMKVYSFHRDSIINIASVNSKFAKLERYIINQIIHDKTERLISFVSNTPIERYLKLIKKHPDIIQKASSKVIATFIGVTAESLSRIRKRLLIE